MSRIVFAWELGSNFGYISQFLPFARELKKRGHEVAMTVRELHHVRRIMEESDISVLQSPLWLAAVQGLPEPPLNYAEILLRYGYHDAQSLAGVVSAWRELLMLNRTDLLVANHAPTALLAARTLGLPAAAMGTGFCIPPQVTPAPNMRYWAQVPQERLQSSESFVLSTINTILAQYQQPQLQAVSQLFATQETFLCTFPEMDHYPVRPGAHYWGPVYNTEMGLEVSWPTHDATQPQPKRVVVYMEPTHRDFLTLLDCLAQSGYDAVICAPGISDNQLKARSTDNIRIFNQPIRFSGMLTSCDLGICHGGHGTTAAMLMAGIPLLMFPSQLEQYLLSTAMQKSGVARLVNPESPPPDIGQLLKQMLESPEAAQFRARARQIGQQHAAGIHDQLQVMTARMEALAAS